MKKLLITAAFSGLMLSACSSNMTGDTEPTPAVAPMTVDQALQECQASVGDNQDRAVFDACMRDKGFDRAAPTTDAATDASAPAM
ncbi:hypothetical protein [Neisseria montereyensis]|uniref:Entry exclusion lipoprotein TrbK n=1 Tax=Neisseria montereyensis TaxID=2973938 RepID=A0ABT2FB11_9NEIS|nr:hypothetical protein [Neisseria montereyensis]MCS4533347.1 hypothetical protein [Neisseria montereyensis]